MIKEIIETVDSNKKYEIYKEVELQAADGGMVNVLQLDETVTVQQLEQEIADFENQIASFQAILTKRQAILAEINNL